MSAGMLTAPLFAFTDETGNSGLNMFDQNQPFFWTGTLLTPVDWDSLSPAIHQAVLDRAGCSELKGNHLGLTGIERIAGKLIQLFQRYESLFLFTRIEKRHLVATKLVDTLMDSGLNKAVSNFHYAVRVNRLYLAHVIVALLDQGDRQEFWTVYDAGDAAGFARILARLGERIHSTIEDKRTKQLLLDAVAWGIGNPTPLLEGTRSPLDSPNVVALTLLIHELHRANVDGGISIQTFVHDEQQEFGTHLEMAFEVSKRFGNVDATSPLAQMINIKEMTTFGCSFRSASSHSSFGLQVLDVALWVTKRYTDDPGSMYGMCRELAEFLSTRGFISQFTQQSMFQEVVRGLEEIQNLPALTPERERNARKLLDQMEASRQSRMSSSLPPISNTDLSD